MTTIAILGFLKSFGICIVKYNSRRFFRLSSNTLSSSPPRYQWGQQQVVSIVNAKTIFCLHPNNKLLFTTLLRQQRRLQTTFERVFNFAVQSRMMMMMMMINFRRRLFNANLLHLCFEIRHSSYIRGSRNSSFNLGKHHFRNDEEGKFPKEKAASSWVPLRFSSGVLPRKSESMIWLMSENNCNNKDFYGCDVRLESLHVMSCRLIARGFRAEFFFHR